MTLILQARAFAIEAHGDQKYGVHPYVVHLDFVVSVLARFGVIDPSILAAAFLHDTIEDTEVIHEDIVEHFGKPVASIVFAVSDGPGRNRRERKARVYETVPQVYGALEVKLADRIANIEQCQREDNKKLLKMYRKEQGAFEDHLRTPEASPSSQRMFSHLDVLFGVHDSEGSS